MLLVGIVARESGIVLRVDGALGLQAFEPAAACVAGHDDFVGRVVRPGQVVAPQHRRPVDGLEAVDHVLQGGGLVLAEPPDFQHVFAGDGVDRDDGSRVGRLKSAGKWVLVGDRVEGISAALLDVAGQADFSRRRGNPISHVDGRPDVARVERLTQTARGRRVSPHNAPLGDGQVPTALATGVRCDRAGLVEVELQFQTTLVHRRTGVHVSLNLCRRAGTRPEAEVVHSESGRTQGAGGHRADDWLGVHALAHELAIEVNLGRGRLTHHRHMHPATRERRLLRDRVAVAISDAGDPPGPKDAVGIVDDPVKVVSQPCDAASVCRD